MAEPKPPVLIVEDDHDTAEALAMMLHEYGQRSVVAATRNQAVPLLKVEMPRVVIMDYMMPGMTAGVFVEHVRRDFPGCKIILMSATTDLKGIAERLQVDAYFMKPVDFAGLAQFVNTLPV